jgi:hypothetical protein
MDEFSVNRLSVMLDVDRQVLVRALRNTPAEAGTERKPLFRVSTAIEALDQHRARPDRRRKENNGGGHVDAELQRMFFRLDDLHDRIADVEAVDERRQIMREEFFPLLTMTTAAMYEACQRSGGREGAAVYIGEHERVELMTLRHVCGWNVEQMMAEYDVATTAEHLGA